MNEELKIDTELPVSRAGIDCAVYMCGKKRSTVASRNATRTTVLCIHRMGRKPAENFVKNFIVNSRVINEV